ncbi:MAG: thiamine pyrophosphate-dependent dehydrogenase E1 component subunit alpha [Candidatus Dormibacteraceae bacterium]
MTEPRMDTTRPATGQATHEPVAAAAMKDWLQTMLVIREFELTADRLSLKARIPGGIHPAAGQEAVAVGAIRALLPGDIVFGSHRTHHHALAKGLSPSKVMAELYGKATGVRGGRGGTMHIVDAERGYFGGNGIVGAAAGLAMGAALAAKLKGADQIAVAFIGEAALNNGRVWEAVNLAAVWRLPLVLVCENNLYAVETRSSEMTAGPGPITRAKAFGLEAESVDGQDPLAVYVAVAAARTRAQSGAGPTFIEALTYRYEGHSTGQVISYRQSSEVEEWRERRDPIKRLRQKLLSDRALSELEFDDLVREAQSIVSAAVEFAEASALPDPRTALDDVTAIDLKIGDGGWKL